MRIHKKEKFWIPTQSQTGSPLRFITRAAPSAAARGAATVGQSVA
jgi:hypothetical protein